MNRNVVLANSQVQGIFGGIRSVGTKADIVTGKELLNFLRSKFCTKKNIFEENLA